MKRIKSTMIGTALLALFAVACEKDEPTVHELVGTWNSTSQSIYYGASIAAADSSDVNTDYTLEVQVFNADNTGSVTIDFFGSSLFVGFTWSTSGSNLTIVLDFGGLMVTSTSPYELTGTTLTITTYTAEDIEFDEPEQWAVTKYTKQ